MSKIFDALRKAEQQNVDLVSVPDIEPSRSEPLAPSRDERLQGLEFGRLSGSIQSAFAKSKEGRVILVVGTTKDEGATYVSTHLGESLAADCGGQVLCVDGDFHEGDLPRKLGARSGLGLTDVEENGNRGELGELVQETDTPNLSVVTTGRTRVSPVAFFDSAHFDALLGAMRRRFRYTVVDGPPLLAHPDSIHLATRVDGVILVVRHGRLKREVLQQALQLLESVHAPLLGAVLNRRRFAIPTLIFKLIT
jgi:capsular exopolysaccharide synthesis family protein